MQILCSLTGHITESEATFKSTAMTQADESSTESTHTDDKLKGK